ncbi:MAG: Sapep family Mn(2+)-dependent dipeptidase [Coriobacteriaceae bacterium]|jgi:succinyl-diaminopimelate desuccinylase|nr:Sapep family Mn(2+)-dependent dipeptidase [Coriobacteriaceae bacterium]
MIDEAFSTEIDGFIERNWEQLVADIAELVRIPSIEEPDKAAPGAPYGPGPALALEAALALARRLGLDPHNCDGHIGYADYPGARKTQLGIIGHVDVVPAGIGWDFEPFDVTRKDGYLVGRGCLDDKGPSVLALYAVRFLIERSQRTGEPLPYTVRFIFGANEESGMSDVGYYRSHFPDPVFVITPDADFPVCYGEKGGYDARITSKPLPKDAVICDFKGGTATNAVPGQATVLLQVGAEGLEPTDRITVIEEGERTRLTATGIGGHASLPEGTVNAIGLLVDYLLEHGLCTAEERSFLEFQQRLLSAHDGRSVGVQASDEAFGPLTLIGGTVALDKDRRIIQTIDIRYPTSITEGQITDIIGGAARAIGAEFENTLLMPPFLIDPDSQVIQALREGYNEAAGEEREPFTIGGGTYAREFTAGASFGPNMPWLEHPSWAGAEHSANEAASEEMFKQALKIYIATFDKLMSLDL